MNLYHKLILTMLSLSLSGDFKGFGPTKSEGILVFERHRDYYFVETKEKDMAKLLSISDTLNITYVTTPLGDVANDIDNYKEYLDKTITFKTLTCLREMEDYDGKRIEYRDTMDYKAGYIFITKATAIILQKDLTK